MKRTITIEFDHTRITTSHDDHKAPKWCDECGAESEFISEAEAIHLAKFVGALGITIREEDMHFYQPGGEQVLICLNSILNGKYPKSH